MRYDASEFRTTVQRLSKRDSKMIIKFQLLATTVTKGALITCCMDFRRRLLDTVRCMQVLSLFICRLWLFKVMLDLAPRWGDSERLILCHISNATPRLHYIKRFYSAGEVPRCILASTANCHNLISKRAFDFKWNFWQILINHNGIYNRTYMCWSWEHNWSNLTIKIRSCIKRSIIHVLTNQKADWC